MNIKFLKTDAIVSVKIGSGFVQRLQQMLFFLLKDIPADKVEDYKKALEGKTGFVDMPEPWMDHVLTLSVLLRQIETNSEEQGLTYEKDPESFNESNSSEENTTNEEEN